MTYHQSWPDAPLVGFGSRVRHHWRGLILCGLVTGCGSLPLDRQGLLEAQSQTPFAARELKSAWVSTLETQMVLERSFGGIIEQRILLSNRTAMRGDNMILMQAHGTKLGSIGRFMPNRIVASTDADLYPFGLVNSLIIRSREDGLGTLNWAEWSNNAGLNCILAFRRLPADRRLVPKGKVLIDMIVRNCVNDSIENALRPAFPRHAGYSAGIGEAKGAPEMLSPLAGPAP